MGSITMSSVELTDQQAENLRTAYRELCTSYRVIDDFRAKLLGFLPLATGTGIFLLVVQAYSWPIGVFGFVITLGLFFYELYGIKKCTDLICAGRQLEENLDVKDGQFKKRPFGVLGFINEPFAAYVIYSAVLAAWIFWARAFPQSQDVTDVIKLQSQHAAQLAAISIAGGFIVGFVASLFYSFIRKCK
jgi:hypothetical protein